MRIPTLMAVALLAACGGGKAVDTAPEPAGLAPTPTTAAVAVVPYPLDTCLVTDQPLTSMGGAVRIEYEGREIRFCCAGCEPTFRQHAKKYLTKLDELVRASKETK